MSEHDLLFIFHLYTRLCIWSSSHYFMEPQRCVSHFKWIKASEWERERGEVMKWKMNNFFRFFLNQRTWLSDERQKNIVSKSFWEFLISLFLSLYDSSSTVYYVCAVFFAPANVYLLPAFIYVLCLCMTDCLTACLLGSLHIHTHTECISRGEVFEERHPVCA